MKRLVRFLFTAFIAGVIVFGVSSVGVHAQPVTKKGAPYQVLTHDKNGKQISIGFQTKSEFEKYIADHPVKAKSQVGAKTVIRSTFYEHINGGGWSFTASANVHFGGAYNDNVSSVRTHPYGNYTYIYEHANGGGYALALGNTGALYNLTDIAMGDGVRNWNDEASSALVRSN
jgi:hypothetical protein